jgi:hypothetical protein
VADLAQPHWPHLAPASTVEACCCCGPCFFSGAGERRAEEGKVAKERRAEEDGGEEGGLAEEAKWGWETVGPTGQLGWEDPRALENARGRWPAAKCCKELDAR